MSAFGTKALQKRLRGHKSRNSGLYFERMVLGQAGLSGILCIKNELSCRWLADNKLLPVRSELDFTLVSRLGAVAFVDAKSFNKESTNRSSLEAHQIKRAYRYNLWRCAAGFVVLFVPLQKVVFYSGILLHCMPPGQTLRPEDGVLLGDCSHFDLHKVFHSDLGVC